ncbi:MAG: LysR family transcriptional regulator [Polyangiaceae bacterium]|nr:LysR family transcriptional regulator [Polyangiaceae bacterium]
MHISWEDLHTLEALVRTGSVEAAGRELALQHSTVSRRIAAPTDRQRPFSPATADTCASWRKGPPPAGSHHRSSEISFSKSRRLEGALEKKIANCF